MTRKKNELIRSKVYYFGISVNNSFWNRCSDSALFERGFGELWLTKNALYFRRYLTMGKYTFKISTKAIIHINTGHALAGKISLPPIMKIHWTKDKGKLVSGFSVPKKIDELRQWQNKLLKVMKAKYK